MKRHALQTLYMLFLGGLLYTYASVLGGCGSALPAHAAAADAVRTLNDTAVAVIETTCHDKAIAAASNPDVTIDQAAAEAAGIVETCELIQDGQHAFAAAHGLWVGFLLQSISQENFALESSLHLVTDVIMLYGEIVPLAARLDLTLPELPPVVTSLLGIDNE